MTAKVAILGGGGAFAIHTARYLLNSGGADQVIGIGRNNLRPDWFSLDIQHQEGYRYYAYHVTHELDLLLQLLDRERPEVIVNFAAQGEGAVSWDNSWRFFETNAMALARLVEELSKRDWFRHFIQIGTSEMYGSVTEPAKEDAPIRPTSPYAASKVAFDLHLMSMHSVRGFPMTILRPSNAYCSGQLLHRIIPKTIVSGLLRRKVPLHGGGRAEKSYIHADDLASAINLVQERPAQGKIYNVGPQHPTSIRTVVELCAKTLEMDFADLCTVVGDREGQDARYWLDSSAIRRDLGWSPAVGWDDGLLEVLSWARAYLHQLEQEPMNYTLRA